MHNSYSEAYQTGPLYFTNETSALRFADENGNHKILDNPSFLNKTEYKEIQLNQTFNKGFKDLRDYNCWNQIENRNRILIDSETVLNNIYENQFQPKTKRLPPPPGFWV